MKNKNIFSRKEIENLFDEIINDLKNNWSNKNGSIQVGKKKIGMIRYFLSIRLDGLTKLKEKEFTN